MRFRTRARPKPVINIISLIDILCILLIFFIVTTAFKKDEPAVKIDLPESSQSQTAARDVPVTIIVTAQDQVFIEDKEVPITDLPAFLKQRAAGTPALKLALKSDRRASFGAIIKVMDAAKAAGVKQLPAFTEEKPATP